MDCNRDEAARSKGIAEKKFLQQDYMGARKFALKARQLFPDLEGLVQFVAVVEVHAIAQEKLHCGEMNWYGILQSDPSADEAVLRKQYRRLALVLHPDKNKSMGADAAFKFISEAWSTLSDKTKKAAYDSKIKPMIAPKSGLNRKSHQCPPAKQSDIPPPTASQPRPRPRPRPHYQPSPHIVLTFWTACPDCKLQYEYNTFYKDKQLCCPICYKFFLARELSVVINGTVIWPLQEQKPVKADTKSEAYNANGYSNPSNFSSGNGGVPVSHSKQTQAESGTRNENTEVRESGNCKEKMPGNEPVQATNNMGVEAEVHDPLVAKDSAPLDQQVSHGNPSLNECTGPVTASAGGLRSSLLSEGHNVTGVKAGDTEDMLQVELNFTPLKKARIECEGAARDGKENTGLCERASNQESAACGPSVGYQSTSKNLSKQYSTTSESRIPSMTSVLNRVIHDTETEEVAPTEGAFDVSDADLYSFNKNRTEHIFEAGQVWACYDDEEGFPRYYAHVSKVISRQPFKIQYTWLEPQSSSEELTAWMDAGFSYSCGEFKLGKTLTGTSLDMFSHKVVPEKMQRGGIRIYPMKGDMWAVYKDWATMKSKDCNVRYEVVEVLSDYVDDEGVRVCLLAKLEGLKAVYQQQFGAEQWILPHEMRRFSHSIPMHRLVAGEVPQEWLEGFLLLDPVSIPKK